MSFTRDELAHAVDTARAAYQEEMSDPNNVKTRGAVLYEASVELLNWLDGMTKPKPPEQAPQEGDGHD